MKERVRNEGDEEILEIKEKERLEKRMKTEE
jgi:hypothetical protein